MRSAGSAQEDHQRIEQHAEPTRNAIARASGTAISEAMAKPPSTRFMLARTSVHNVPSFSRLKNPLTTAAGSGSNTGLPICAEASVQTARKPVMPAIVQSHFSGLVVRQSIASNVLRQELGRKTFRVSSRMSSKISLR